MKNFYKRFWTLLIILPLCSAAQLSAQKITIKASGVKLETILKEITHQTKKTFAYSSELVDVERTVSLDVRDAGLEQVLDLLFKDTQVVYSINNDKILLSPKAQIASTSQRETVAVSGMVRDESGNPIAGVTVLVKGTMRGTATDGEGKYVIQAFDSSVLLFSMIGYEPYEVPVGAKVLVNVILRENRQEINEVVVTALGIKREQKALGYATQTIDNETLTGAPASNWSQAMAGKVAGMNISTLGGPVGSTRVTLRGDVSLNIGGNDALIVIDGVPLSNDITNEGVAFGAGGGSSEMSIDYGNGFSDINPDDIDNVQVLKGASATALYGSRAANGVVMITTKSGKQGPKGLGVTFSSHFSIEDVLRWPDYQYEFGQGLPSYIGKDGTQYAGQQYYSYGASPDGNNGTSGTSSAYGPRFNPDVYYYQYHPILQKRGDVPTPWVPYENNLKDFFQLGYTITNNVAVSGKSETGSIRLSLSHTKNEWILPNTGFNRLNVGFAGEQQVNRTIKLNVHASYTNRTIENTPGIGYNSNTLAYFMIATSPNINTKWLSPMWFRGQENIRQLQPFSPYIGNPYLVLYESTNPSDRHSFISSAAATVAFNRKLDLMVRSALQITTDEREQRRPYSDAVYYQGYFRKQQVGSYQFNTDFLLTYNEKLGRDFRLKTSLGGNIMNYHYSLLSAAVTGLVTPGVYKLSNGMSAPFVNSWDKNKVVYSLYGTANLSWKERVYLDVTGRNDWSSTLPRQNRSFFYPSVSASILLHEFVDMPRQFEFMKLRLSFAQVGNDTDPYKTARYYAQGNFPGSASMPTTLHNTDFKPEISSGFEVGADFRFFRNRIGIDATYYYNSTRNQILDIPMDPTIGFTRGTVNAGNVRNTGVELMLNGRPVWTGKVKWKTSINWSTNRNTILELAEGFTSNQVIAGIGAASIIGQVGGSTGDLWGYKLVRNAAGEVIINESGLPARPEEIEYIGCIHPKWKGGWSNEISFGNLKFSFLIDGQYKGLMYSHSYSKATELGKLKHTLNGRLPGTEYYIPATDPRIEQAGLTPLDGVYMVAPGVRDNGDGTYSPNTKLVTVEEYYREYYRRENVETNSFDASYIKLREVRIEYRFPKKLLDRTFIGSATIAVYGRNLWMWTRFPWFDPESAALNGSNIVPGIETGQIPSTKTYGISLSLSL